MDDESKAPQYRRIFRDIVRGFSDCKVLGKKLYLKHLSSQDQVDLDDVYQEHLEHALSRGIESKAETLKNLYKHLNIVDWGEIPDFDMIINATSVGLNKQESLNLDFSKIKDKFFYDVIYNPNETDFLKNAKKLKNTIENGKKMFVYQAAAAFKIWHGIEPKINNKIFELLD